MKRKVKGAIKKEIPFVQATFFFQQSLVEGRAIALWALKYIVTSYSNIKHSYVAPTVF